MASPLILPHGLTPEKKTTVLSRADVSAVLAFEQLCEKHGMKFILICQDCHHDHPREAACKGDNSPGDAAYKIECGCTRREYRDTPH